MRFKILIIGSFRFTNVFQYQFFFFFESTGLYNKLNRLNTINNQDKNGNNNHKNNTQFYIERSPWWLSLKQNNSVIGSKF